ncbi:MAG: hypothetical protein AMJ79_15545 [Phycisphaerae bacterium SM23_30]|nr:MAG: hypothetical protein AMJ79_15545 [Phycisphaerae bacterium SM23_30]
MDKQTNTKKHRKKLIWLIIILLPLFSTPITIYLLWRLDAPPIENDYTISDLRTAPPDAKGSYELLLGLQNPTKIASVNEAKALAESLDKFNQIIKKHGGSIEEILAELKAEKETREIIGVANPTLGLTAEDDKVIRICCNNYSGYIRDINLQKLRENAVAIDLAWEHAQKARDIIQKLNQFPEIDDQTPPDLLKYINSRGLYTNIKQLASLYWIKTYLECERENYDSAIEYSVELNAFPRKLLSNARDVSLKMCCYSLVQKSTECANHIVNLQPVLLSQIQNLLKHFPPLSDRQISLQNCQIFDYLSFKNIVYDMQKTLQVLNKPAKLKIRSGLLKPNSTLQLYKNSVFFKPINQSIYPAIYPDSWTAIDKSGNRLTWQYEYYNPYGALLFATCSMITWGRVRQTTDTMKVHDDLFHLIARRRLEPDFDLAAAVKDMGFTIDLEAQKIHRQKFDAYGFLAYEIKLDINPSVLDLK